MSLEAFTAGYQSALNSVAVITVKTLELIGILIIIIGSIKALGQILKIIRQKKPINIMVELGKTLALALEFKMGAEIVNTVIVREIEELIILALVIALRAILAILIHWEIKNEKKEDEIKQKDQATAADDQSSEK